MRGKKRENVIMYLYYSENVFFKALAKIFLLTWKSCFMADLLPNGLHEKIMICSICYTIKSRLDAQFVKKIPLEMVIGQQIKEEGYDQNNGVYIKLSIHLLLK